MTDKKLYVLVSDKYGINGMNWDGYYTGDIYRFQGENYAVCDTDIDKAKKYTSLKRAENAKETINRKIANYWFEVKEV